MCRLVIDDAESPVLMVQHATCVVDPASDQIPILFECGGDQNATAELEQKRRHDLKNESAAIKVGLAVVKQCLERGDSAQASEFLETLLDQAERLDEQIDVFSATRLADDCGEPVDGVGQIARGGTGRFRPADGVVHRILFLSSEQASREAFCDLCAESAFSAVATDDAEDALAWLSRQDEVAGIFCDGSSSALPHVLTTLQNQAKRVPPTCEMAGVPPEMLDGDSSTMRSAFADAIGLACRLA